METRPAEAGRASEDWGHLVLQGWTRRIPCCHCPGNMDREGHIT